MLMKTQVCNEGDYQVKKRRAAIFVITVVICILIAVLLLKVSVKHTEIYDKYKFCEEFFGEKLYAELDYISTESEKQVGEEITEKMEYVLEYIGDEETADTEVGALKRYYWFPYYDKPALCSCKVKLMTTKLEREKGHVWVEYSVNRYDENGDLMQSGSSITLLYIEKENGRWKVTDIEEPA